MKCLFIFTILIVLQSSTTATVFHSKNRERIVQAFKSTQMPKPREQISAPNVIRDWDVDDDDDDDEEE